MQGSSSTIEQFLDAVAAKSPTPAGGSVSALAGAMAAALGELVLNVTVHRKGSEAFAPELRPLLDEFHRARQLLLQLMVEDQAAFEALLAARKLPADAPDRQTRIDAALLASIRVPQVIAATAVAMLELCDRILQFAAQPLLADLAVCADLAMATTRCAIYSVRANAMFVAEQADRAAIESKTNQLLTRAAQLIQSVAPRIWQRHSEGP